MRILAALLLVLPLTACGPDDEQTLTVFAAASLTTVFDQLEGQFEDKHPGVDVRISYGGSADLVAQIEEGAEADVFASADEVTMDRLISSHATGPDPVSFATNTLTIAVAPGNPEGISTLGDLSRPGLDLVMCAPEVPCGRAANEVADRYGVTLEPVSEEQSVTDVLAKVSEGEADAGLVYVTDVAAADGAVDGVALREFEDAVNDYSAVVVDTSTKVTLARAFLELLLGAEGRSLLTDAGFGPPAP